LLEESEHRELLVFWQSRWDDFMPWLLRGRLIFGSRLLDPGADSGSLCRVGGVEPPYAEPIPPLPALGADPIQLLADLVQHPESFCDGSEVSPGRQLPPACDSFCQIPCRQGR
jgi:hypothetical protein